VKAGLRGDDAGMMAAAQRLGYVVEGADEAYLEIVRAVFRLALEPMLADGPYDFGASDLAARMNAVAEDIWGFRDAWQAPPSDALFFHRKVGGMFMLASRMRARVDVAELLDPLL